MGDKCKCITSRLSPHRSSKCALRKNAGALLGAGLLGVVAAGVTSKVTASNKKNNTRNNAEAPPLGIPLLNVENVSEINTAEVVLCGTNGDTSIFVDDDFVCATSIETEPPTVDKINTAFDSSVRVEDVSIEVEGKEEEGEHGRDSDGIEDAVWVEIGSSILEGSNENQDENTLADSFLSSLPSSSQDATRDRERDRQRENEIYQTETGSEIDIDDDEIAKLADFIRNIQIENEQQRQQLMFEQYQQHLEQLQQKEQLER